MKRSWHIWLGFSVCLAVVMAAMMWISLRALHMEQTAQRAQAQAAVEETVRLALWRMDSALTPLITQETSRPYFSYMSFHPVDRAYSRMFAQLKPDDVLVPSPLLTLRAPSILLHFQIAPNGLVTSPQAPSGNEQDLAESSYITREQLKAAQDRLGRLRTILRQKELIAALPEPAPATLTPATHPAVVVSGGDNPVSASTQNAQAGQNTLDNNNPNAGANPGTSVNVKNFQALDQQQRNASDYNARSGNIIGGQALAQNTFNVTQQRQQFSNSNFDPLTNVQAGLGKTLWIDGNLLLAMRVRVGANEYVQGCWLDWDQIRTWLLGELGELLPNASLEPCPTPASGHEYMLAALPVKLNPGNVPYESSGPKSPIGMTLVIAWLCLLAGAIAVAAVLHGTIALSERRGAFVSAVTHEMRTPLTTFRLYADLLSGGMVPDAAKQQTYLRRLCDEAQRLSHLVENVLAYARLSGPRKGSPLDTMSMGELVDRSRDRLAARAQQSGMELSVETSAGAPQALLSVRLSVVEQILLNLIDNACKYAAGAADKRIHLLVESSDGHGVLRVRDHGPGLPERQRKRLFQAFCRSAHEAAGSSPGVGLGLALSRRLARDMRGDLEFEASYTAGAGFALKLPKAKA